MTRVLIFAIAACGSPIVHGSITESEPIAMPDEWVSCRADADCVALEMDCCDHCNGGWVLAVNHDHVARAAGAYHAVCDSAERANADGSISFCGPSCTEVGCGPIGQLCQGGRCTWTWDANIDGQFIAQPDVLLPARVPANHEPVCSAVAAARSASSP